MTRSSKRAAVASGTVAVAAAIVVAVGAGRATASPSIGSAGPPRLPASALAVVRDGRSSEWWASARAPNAWNGRLAVVTAAIEWQAATAGIKAGELVVEGSGEARRTRIIIAVVDPRAVMLRLDAPAVSGFDPPAATWSVSSAPAGALLAVNAGQFSTGGPWGWLVRDGQESQPARLAPLAPAVIIGADGTVHIVRAAAIDSARVAAQVVDAFQSYPSLLEGGLVPVALTRPDRGIDVAHRDARLALGTLPDGRVVIALTRFDGLHGALSELPLGLTTPEMAAVMGALGCRDAVLLDGGVSGQLAIRDSSGQVRSWPGLRRVPLGLIALRETPTR